MQGLKIFIETALARYGRGSFWLVLPQGMSLLIGFGLLPLILHHIPPYEYGMLQFVIAGQAWATIFTAGQMTYGAKRGIANGQIGTFLYVALYRWRFFVVVGLVGLCLALAIVPTGNRTLAALVAIMSAYLLVGYLSQVSYPEFFIATRRFRAFALTQIAMSVIANGLAVTAAVMTGNVMVFAAVQFGVLSIVSLVVFLVVLFRYGVYAAYRRGDIVKDAVPYGLRLIPADMLNGTAAQAGSFLIGSLLGFIPLSIFSLASRLDGAVRNTIGVLYNLLYADFAVRGKEDIVAAVRRRLPHTVAASVAVWIVFVVASTVYIRYAAPPEYQSAIWYVIILSVSLPATVLQVILQTILETNFQYREMTRIALVPNLVKIGLIGIGGYLGGLLGICLGIAVGGWIMFFFYYSLTIRQGTAKTL